MAHAATINTLVSDLVSSITGLEQDGNGFAALRTNAVKTLRSQSTARVNQFAVKARLEGLVEKFAVFNRDDLSDALQSRLEEVSTQAKHVIDVLSLLLELSDRPTDNSSIKDLEALDQPVVDHQLTWDEIIADDPLDEPDIWDDVERAYHSSGDDAYDEDDSEPTVSTQASSLLEEDAASAARQLLLSPDEGLLRPLRQVTQIWRAPKKRSEPIVLPELVVLREVIAMLNGLPTRLFLLDGHLKEVSLARKVMLGATSADVISHLLEDCADTGSALNFLRYWTSVPQRAAFQQSIQSAVMASLTYLSVGLSRLEQEYIMPERHSTVSIVALLEETNTLTRPLAQVSRLMQQCTIDHFAVLDALYAESCTSQITGDRDVYGLVTTLFSAGLQTYLRLVAAWAETGSAPVKDRESSFVNDADSNCELGKLWQSRFAMRLQASGEPFIPQCLQHLAGHIFALGKSRAFLRRLERSSDDLDDVATTESSSINLRSVHQAAKLASVTSFEQLLSDDLSQWLATTATDCTPQLCSALLHDHGLERTLAAIPFVYFSKDSSLFLSFSEALFDRLHSSPGSISWNDRFILTELAHSTLGQAPSVDAENIYISSDNNSNSNDNSTTSSNAKTLPSSPIQQLASLTLEYRFPWPIQNITRTPTSAAHAQILTLLLQITYAARILTTPTFFSLRTAPHPSSPQEVPPAWKFRHRLRTFLTLLQSHLTSTAHALHTSLVGSMRAAQSIDAMLELWRAHELELQRCLLVAPRLAPLREAVVAVLRLCERVASTATAGGQSNGKNIEVLEEEFERVLHFLLPGIRGLSRGGSQGPGGGGGSGNGGSTAAAVTSAETPGSTTEMSAMGVGAGVGTASLEALADRLEWDMRI